MSSSTLVTKALRRYAPLLLLLGIQVVAAVVVPSRAPVEPPVAGSPSLAATGGGPTP